MVLLKFLLPGVHTFGPVWCFAKPHIGVRSHVCPCSRSDPVNKENMLSRGTPGARKAGSIKSSSSKDSLDSNGQTKEHKKPRTGGQRGRCPHWQPFSIITHQLSRNLGASNLLEFELEQF